jgi:hypothetical protein
MGLFDPQTPVETPAPLMDYGVTSAKRQRMLAEALRKQAGAATPQGQMVSGHYVAPSWAQHLATIAGGAGAGYMEGKAQEAEDKSTRELQAAKQKWLESTPQAGAPTVLPAAISGLGGREKMTPEQVIPGQAVTPAQVLKHALAGKMIPGMEGAADLYSKGALAEIDREDRQVAAKEAQIAALQEKRDEAERRSNDLARSDAQRAESKREQLASEERIARMNNELRRDIANIKAGGDKAPTETSSQSKERQAIEYEVTSSSTRKQALDEVEKVLPNATGTKGGQLLDAAGKIVNYTTEGAKAQTQLKTLEGTLLAHTPKFSGPTSDRDVAVYQKAVGDLANPDLTVAERQAALVQVKRSAELAVVQARARAESYNKRAVGEDYKVELPELPKKNTGGAGGSWGGEAPAAAPAKVGKPAPDGATQVINGVLYTKRGGQWFPPQ